MLNKSISFKVYKEYTLRLLVQVKQHDTNDPFQCLVLSPIYSRKQKESENSNVFRSCRGSAFIGFSVLLATVNEGYLYQFSNNGKSIEGGTILPMKFNLNRFFSNVPNIFFV